VITRLESEKEVFLYTSSPGLGRERTVCR